MGRALEHGLPCKLCGSSDATALYENGYHCFSCGESYDDEENGEEPVFDTTQTTDVIEESDWIKNCLTMIVLISLLRSELSLGLLWNIME